MWFVVFQMVPVNIEQFCVKNAHVLFTRAGQLLTQTTKNKRFLVWLILTAQKVVYICKCHSQVYQFWITKTNLNMYTVDILHEIKFALNFFASPMYFTILCLVCTKLMR